VAKLPEIGKISQKVIQHGPIQIGFQVKNDLLTPELLAKTAQNGMITYGNAYSVKE